MVDRVRVVVAVAVWGLLALWGALLVAWVVHDVVGPESACASARPLFEGLAVQRAERAWPPPLVRCTFVDTDPDQLGETAAQDLWGVGDLVMPLALGACAIGFATFVAMWVRRRWVRSRRAPNRSVSPAR